ncbi:MAG: hypothetical protein KJO82_02465 [Gammaproteobacteria bacterium]|nr:hypothetical protein [Gammaproteobacteria bacterium]
MSYHVDRFYAAVAVLASHGHIKQRLISAFETHLADIDDNELPVALKQPFADLRATIQCVPPANGEGRTCATVRKMSPEEAGECAVSIVTLYRDMLRMGDDSATPLPVDLSEQPQVPPFLLKSV